MSCSMCYIAELQPQINVCAKLEHYLGPLVRNGSFVRGAVIQPFSSDDCFEPKADTLLRL